ncbi:MAG TPA: carbamoyltransferase C-terminal domain-containing protein [Victivallales bacterium]|nr:carbamoyltransferase C-terminal domain-containing protein [Victivallales bacterium]
MYILGINTGLNSSVVLMKDNRVIFGIQEERLSKIKNQPGFPSLAINAALKHSGLKIEDVDIFAFGGKHSKIAQSRQDALNKFHSRYNAIKKKWFGSEESSFVKYLIKGMDKFQTIQKIAKGEIVKSLEDFLKEMGIMHKHKRYDHHYCHAASAYYGMKQSGDNSKYLVFSMDGGGDWRTSAVFIGENGKLTEIASSDAFSPACVYAHITYIMGFMPHEHEYKLMGLAPYAQPKYAKIAKDMLMQFVDFATDNPLVFTNGKKYPHVRNSRGDAKQELVEDLFKNTLNMRFDTLAAGLQLMAEDVAVRWIKAGVEKTGIRKVLLSGGFFMNVKANKLISELPELEFVNVFPSCGDETNAFGAAFLAYNDNKSSDNPDIEFEDFCLGIDATYDIEEAKQKYSDKVNFEYIQNINDKLVELLLQRKIVARASGCMEFGAGALGNRSILASPDDIRIINKINAAIKKRDFWMPFAPAVLEDKLEAVVEVPESLRKVYSPYMMFTFNVKPQMQDKIIAGVHQADKTARAQTVNSRIYPEFYDIISKFEEQSGIPAVLNTSFNLHGYPIVLAACDAIDVYLNSEIDVLIVGNYLITKK